MFAKYFPIFIFFLSLNIVKSQNNGTELSEEQIRALIQQYKDICVPTPMAFSLLSNYQPDCRKLISYPSNETKFYCCEIEFQEKKNASAPRLHGCMSILTNYIDNNRYEDMIDYIKRGKLDKIQQYSIFLGRNASAQFTNIFKNNTKHNVYKFDCLSKTYVINYYMMFVLFYLIFGIF